MDAFISINMIKVMLMYLGVGAIAGVLAGLLGVGGGLVIVPMMVITLTWQGIPQEHIMHLALGTSLASIIFTSVSSFMAHHRRGAVQWQVVRQIVVGILLGTFLGATLASRLSTGVLKGIFIVFLYYMGIQFLMDRKPKASRTLPGPWGMFGVGVVIGVVSAFVGIGGGSLSVPYMIYCNLPVHTAIGTSAAIGFPIAVAGAVGYLVNGLAAANLAPLVPGLYLSARPPGHCRHERPHRAPGRPPGPQSAGEPTQTGLRRPPPGHGH